MPFLTSCAVVALALYLVINGGLFGRGTVFGFIVGFFVAIMSFDLA